MQKSKAKKTKKSFVSKLRLLLVPHKQNNYRPYLVRRYGLMVILAMAISMQLFYNFTQTGSVLGRVTNITPAALLADTNIARNNEKLGALSLNPSLSQAASEKAQDMIDKGYWSHTSPTGTQPWYWIEQVGYNYQEAGENLAKNFSTAQATIDAWMNSPTHRENMLKTSYTEVGFGIASGEVDGKSTVIVVAFYAEPVTTSVAGLMTSKTTSTSEQGASLSIAAHIGIAIQSLTPAAITSVTLLFIAATVAITAHFYRSKLPKKQRESWYRHHGMAKASGLLVVTAFIVLIYGGGQI